MAFTLNGVSLPYGLLWVDEHTWTPYAQTSDYGLTGSPIIQIGMKQAGRPITLQGAEDRAWLSQATLDALKALLGTSIMTLVLPDGRTFSVLWDHSGPPISATPVKERWPGAGEKYRSVTLKLLTV